MKEMLERFKNSMNEDLVKAYEVIEDLQDKYESLQEEFNDYKKNIDENYEQKKIDEYFEYGLDKEEF